MRNAENDPAVQYVQSYAENMTFIAVDAGKDCRGGAGMNKVDFITRRDPLELVEAVGRFINNDKNIVNEVHYVYANGNYVAFIHYRQKEEWEKQDE